MAISELQIALIGAGAAAVACVWGYNAWQDRKHRKTADRIFRGGQGDALLPGGVAPKADQGQRQEPHFGAVATGDLPAMPADAGAAGEAHPVPQEPEPLPPLPAEWADAVADCVLRFVTADPVPAPAVWAMQEGWAGELSKGLHWLGQSEEDGTWHRVDAGNAGRYRTWAVALQIADRRGPVSDGELARFFEDVQQVAKQAGASLVLPSRGEAVMRAGKLDEFCATVDIQFVLHVVETSGGVFAGARLNEVAAAAGLVLESDGVFRARDAAGGEIFSVANIGAERLDPDSIKSLATHGLTLSLDVPRVADGAQAFDRMLATARQLAAVLGGSLVDAQRAPLADAMIDAIRARTAALQQRMRDGGIVAGSVRALRLFS